MRVFARIAALAALLLAAACATPPPPPTTVDLKVAADATSNGGAPVQVKVYYLNSTAAFKAGDFFALFNEPQATLGADLMAVDTYLLQPGTEATDAKSFDVAPAAVGVIAAFRSVDQPGWRAEKALAPNAPNPVIINISGQSVALQ